ncbi:hypothetical protein B2J93_6430 [Marssonina coronariae]|uniref:PARP-type domain-containing protein n=1 Tax=Diplocarpon coronariae TaxID=2795749 RepID=A0A218Z6F9_9HELO|nr:hypothetical protein B2J93_6430 [Marssonina coronariae]
MPYRVETASTARAGCNSTECKAAGIKIDKDDLRLGVWVPFEDRGSWKWRHWGCVTGKVIEGIRNLILDPANPGTYRWDMLDGYDSEGIEKNSLERKPELQEKVRRCITQGFIDEYDFNGDPEMNVLGAVGLRTKEKKKSGKDQMACTHALDQMKAEIALGEGTAAGKKRAKVEVDRDEATPVKKKRAIKEKADSENGEDIKPAKPASKTRLKEVKKEEYGEVSEATIEDSKPVPSKKSRAKKAIKKEEEIDEMTAEANPAPARKSRAKGVKKEEQDAEMSGTAGDDQFHKNEEDFNVPVPVIAPKKRALGGKKAVKAEPADEDAVANDSYPEEAKPAPKKRSKKAVKDGKIKKSALTDDSKSGVLEGPFVYTNT